MHCPRCGAPNDDARAACWNCFGQLIVPGSKEAKAEQKAAEADRKKEKKEKKGRKGVIEEPTVAPEPVVEEAIIPVAAAAVVAAEAVEIEPVPTEIAPVFELAQSEPEESLPSTGPEPLEVEEPTEPEPIVAHTFAETEPSPLDIPALTASDDESPAPDFSEAPAFGAPFDFSTEPAEEEPAAEAAADDAGFIAGIPMGFDSESEEEDASPNDARVMDLDAPISESSYVIPGLADSEPGMAEDVPETDDLVDFGSSFDLDSDEPGKKTDG